MLDSRQEVKFEEALADIEKSVKESVEFLTNALEAMAQVRHLMQDAEDKVFDTPNGDRIGSLTMDLENLEAEVQTQIERMMA